MAKTTIQWTDHSFNLVWGCEGCYLGDKCYAKKIAKRYAIKIAEREYKFVVGNNLDVEDRYWISENAKDLAAFEPTYLGSQTLPKLPVKPVKIFANSMSDIASWLPVWIKDLIEICKKNPQHTFQILTKFPYKLRDKMTYLDLRFPKNVWLGLTTSSQDGLDNYWILKSIIAGKHFLSIEPIYSPIDLNKEYFPINIVKAVPENDRTKLHEKIDWLILGVETGGKKSDYIINSDAFIYDLIEQAKRYDVPIFVKTILIDGKILKDNFPKEYNYKQFPS